MNSNHKKTYISPTSETLELKPQGMLCESTQCSPLESRTDGGSWSGGDVWY
jgi:hypothetical protein